MSFLEGYVVGRVVASNLNANHDPNTNYRGMTLGAKFTLTMGGIMLGGGGLMMLATAQTGIGALIACVGLAMGITAIIVR